jgi:cytochrome c peroxidase
MLKLRVGILSGLLLGTVAVVAAEHGPPTFLPNLFPFPNPTGILTSFNSTGKIDLTGPFFQSLGTNGRSCASCHQASDAWSVSAAHVAERFEDTKGLDPIFRTNDGSNCDHSIDTSTVEGRRHAYSLLTSRGLIRIALPIPAGAEFDVVSVNNPYGCNETSTLSMYRRTLPSTNLRFLSTLMWDGRESSTQTGTNPITFATNPGDLRSDLSHQAVDATNGHAQGSTPLTAHQQQQIVTFEMGLSTAQAIDFGAGSLDAHGASGGPMALFNQPFFVGVNDPLGQNPFKRPFSSVIFTLFTPIWAHTQSDDDRNDHRATHRTSILRGQTLFNSHPINITGVGGLNDATGLPVMQGTCGTCHDTPNVGNHSVSAPLNIGVADLTNPLGVSYLPVITLRQKADPTKEISTTDPGRALVTGKWADIGKFKGPILRGLSARAPYFHNGSAASLKEVIEFYNARFDMGLTEREKTDLVAFLRTL